MAQRSIFAYLRQIDGQGGLPGHGDRRGQATEPPASRADPLIWRSRPDAVGAAVHTLGVAAAIAAAYFLAARLGLALLFARSDVAVFWPSGVAAGILIVLGRRAVPALLIGVVVGTVAAGVRGPLTSLLNGFWNAGEALLAAWLLEHWFGRSFTFSDLRRVAGFSSPPASQLRPPPSPVPRP